MANASNVATLIDSEVLANSIGGTLVSNTLQFSNATGNGSLLEFSLAGVSLPIVNGSITVYPTVNVSVFVGQNGNTTDPVVLSANVVPTNDQQGAFFLNGYIIIRANGKSAGANANIPLQGVMQVPVAPLGGSVDAIKTVYAFATANGTGNTNLNSTGAANVANITFFVQPNNPTTNCNTSITTLIAWTSNGNGSSLF